MRTLNANLKAFFFIVILFLGTSSRFSVDKKNGINDVSQESSLYDEMELSTFGLKKDVFDIAMKGWNTLSQENCIGNPSILSIADMSLSSNAKRLYVIDMGNKKVLFNTYVAHGRNSGEEFAYSFSNKPNSFQSSLGFYITDNTYEGAHGLSMKLKGAEQGINDVAEQRGIVMHGADYVSESFISRYGRLGRSQGCPAVPQELCSPIVNSIKGGSCFFVFYPDSNYLSKSRLL